MDLGIAGKVAFVSGGSMGMGRTTAELFASEGCRVVVAALPEHKESIDDTVAAIHAAGGQAVGKILDRTFGLEGTGLAFYEFPVRAKPYKDAYRARLDNLDLNADQIDRAVDEVKIAFNLNQALFNELAGNLSAYQR